MSIVLLHIIIVVSIALAYIIIVVSIVLAYIIIVVSKVLAYIIIVVSIVLVYKSPCRLTSLCELNKNFSKSQAQVNHMD